ncbi:MAG: sigma-70 family RNA polymerase sigma factor [Polyangiaceae bacterium]|nr:sigma-70 family RNA polymerase sigma factor [Polyangiaceae bacterium]
MSQVTDRTALTSYRADIASKKPLSPRQEQDLVVRWREGDSRAGALLIEACLPFVMTIALEYRRWGIPTEDIVQEGNIGLLKAAVRFDPGRGCRLVTYAAYWIRAEIRDFVVRSYRVVRLGASKAERRALRHYRKTRERDPEALAAASGLSVEKAERLLPLLMVRDVSLDDRDPEGNSPSDRIASSISSPEEDVAGRQHHQRMREALQAALSSLTPRERTIVEQRYLVERPLTLEQVGVQFGISKERVRQLEERAKQRMRASIDALTADPSSPQSPTQAVAA